MAGQRIPRAREFWGDGNSDEWSELKELRKENRRLSMEAEFLKAAAFFGRGEQVTFKYILAERSDCPVACMCRALEVSRSGYYAWLYRKESRHEAMDK